MSGRTVFILSFGQTATLYIFQGHKPVMDISICLCNRNTLFLKWQFCLYNILTLLLLLFIMTMVIALKLSHRICGQHTRAHISLVHFRHNGLRLLFVYSMQSGSIHIKIFACYTMLSHYLQVLDGVLYVNSVVFCRVQSARFSLLECTLILGWYCQVSLYPFNHEPRKFNTFYNEAVGILILGYLKMCRTTSRAKLLVRWMGKSWR